ncbi:class II aldolase/adducin family protein [Gordonia sp. 'Campus']|uniref:class II aldolase/adducin family protein n=1 Tax=Gordonia sp. 'Campus' TaxID=2915824 RepID=UPI001EE3C827|nr:class II aldolase/adducin family protein [Gordonia sp. 'Campus']
MSQKSLREQVAEAARRLAAEGLLIGTSGNVSARSGDRVAVTGSGVVLADCSDDEVTEVTLTGDVLSGDVTPSSELGLHLKVYDRTDAQAVVHTHAPFSSAVACVDGLTSLPVLHYQQLGLGGAIPIAPYATFGSPELADAVASALVGSQAALMANHGSVARGSGLAHAVDNALLLEWLATLYHRTSSMGRPRVLTADEQEAAITQAIRLDYGSPKENRT